MRLGYASGYSLMELVMTIAVTSLLVLGGTFLLSETQKSMVGSDKSLSFLSSRQEALTQLRDSCAIRNTVLDPKNSGLKCLEAQTCAGSENGPLLLRDRDNSVIQLTTVNGLTLNLAYEVRCPNGDCTSAFALVKGIYSSQAESTLNMNNYNFEVPLSATRNFINCKEVRDGGLTASGLYWLDPDGAGGVCPFEAYCHQGMNAGGWTLIISATVESPDSIPGVQTKLVPGMTGRLSEAQISALLKASRPGPTENNILTRVEPALSPPQIISLRSTGALPPGPLVSDPAYCLDFKSATPPETLQKEGTSWGFTARRGDTRIGFESDGFVCKVCSTVGACSLPSGACCGHGLKGSVWVR